MDRTVQNSNAAGEMNERDSRRYVPSSLPDTSITGNAGMFAVSVAHPSASTGPRRTLTAASSSGSGEFF